MIHIRGNEHKSAYPGMGEFCFIQDHGTFFCMLVLGVLQSPVIVDFSVCIQSGFLIIKDTTSFGFLLP